ncbi:MAG: alpha/beta hydrolase [Chloroflexi bacterium]|nr:MAG: alpha/beta hydrolase [Chloroflexota bacterium]MBL1195947.1 alpha/beta hydrolase [Chloroflexota bacterium]NOH13241.1 alpha/beta hydrolase [Chloroflexota bacterium]
MQLPIGYQPFHKINFFNYQMNRLHALGYGRQEDIQKAAAKIKDRDTYVSEFETLAAEAQADSRHKNAAAYLRAAEFFAEHGSQKRADIYRRYHEAFYSAFADENITRHEVPYNESHLPAMQLNPAGDKGTIMLFGGFDSLIEEFFVIWKFFSKAGYRVIAFEGPGQGGALQMYGHHFDHDWEKPVAAILDHFDIQEAALIGISMGGYWAVRAAAFEPRIKQVVSWSPVYDWLEQLPGFVRPMLNALLKLEGFMNATIRLRMRLLPILDHAMRQAMYMVGGEQPMDGVRWLLGMNRQHIHSEKVTQDVMLVGGENDAFQPVKLLYKQREALTNAHSVTTRVFTKAEHADMHCQMGNLNLAMGEIEGWLTSKM